MNRTKIKSFAISFAIALAVLVGWDGLVPFASAQVTLRSTTLAAAVASDDREITVASATGVEVNDIAYVDREALKVTAINGAVLSVNRGQEGTSASAHANAAVIYVDDPSYYSAKDRFGSCTSTVEKVLPVVNVRNGKVFQCYGSLWAEYAVNYPLTVGPASVGTRYPRFALTVTTTATAGAATYTAAQILGGIILRDPAGAARSDVTPTAALLVAAIPGAQIGTAFEFTIRNTADAAETITVTAGTGATLSGTMTIVQDNTKRFLVRLDVVASGSEAYTVYSLGTIVH